MIRHSLSANRFIALLMPAILLWSWTACVIICDEAAEHASREINAVSTLTAAAELIGQTPDSECCRLTATPAAFPERQNIAAPALTTAEIVFASVRRPAFVSFIIKSDINQNSPPEISIPIFLKLTPSAFNLPFLFNRLYPRARFSGAVVHFYRHSEN